MMTTQTILRPLIKADKPAAWHLIMCPFTRAGNTAFRNWHDLHIDISLAIYLRRDHRMHEPFAQSIKQLAEDLAEEINSLAISRHQHLLLAGHSMGAQVAFETCPRLEQGGTPPTGLVLSGCHAPHLQGRHLLSHLDDEAFLAQLIDIGSCHPSLLTEPSLMTLFMPLLRNGLRVTEADHCAQHQHRQYLYTPTLLLYGSYDQEASYDEVQAWQMWLPLLQSQVNTFT